MAQIDVGDRGAELDGFGVLPDTEAIRERIVAGLGDKDAGEAVVLDSFRKVDEGRRRSIGHRGEGECDLWHRCFLLFGFWKSFTASRFRVGLNGRKEGYDALVIYPEVADSIARFRAHIEQAASVSPWPDLDDEVVIEMK